MIIVLKKIISIFIITFVGFIANKKGILPNQSNRYLVDLLTHRGHGENLTADDSVLRSPFCGFRISVLDALYQNPENERSS